MQVKSIEHKERKPVIQAFIISGLFIFLCAMVGTSWETNDDPGFVDLMTMSESHFTLFQWKILTWVLRFLYVNYPIREWWAVNSFFAVWLYVFASTYVVLRRHRGWRGYVINAMMLIISWHSTIYFFNFTRTAVAAAMGGCLLVADCLLKDEQNNPIEYFLGWVLLLYGGAIRFESALLALGWLAVIGGVWFLTQNFRLNLSWIKFHKNQIIGLFLTACILFLGYAANKMSMTPEERVYDEYNTLRSNVEDYDRQYPKYHDARETYSKAGFDEHSLTMFMNWFSEDTELITRKSMEDIGILRKNRMDWVSIGDNVKNSAPLLLLCGLLLFPMVISRKWNWLRFLPILLFVCFCAIVFAYSGRLIPRVFEVILLCAIWASVFLAGDDDGMISVRATGSRELTAGSSRIHAAVLVGVYCISGLICILQVNDQWLFGIRNYAKPWMNYNHAEKRSNTLDIIHEDAEHLYFYDLSNEVLPRERAFSLWEPRPIGYCENYIPLGGWEARHPRKVEILEEKGITNPVRALFEREDSYGTYSPRLLKYLHRKYDSTIHVTEVFQIDDTPIVYYTAYKDETQLAPVEEKTAKLLDLSYVTDRKEKDIWYLAAEVEPTTENDPVLYCNITVDGVRSTYRLKYMDGRAAGYFYGISESFDPASADVVLYEHASDDAYVQYEMH